MSIQNDTDSVQSVSIESINGTLIDSFLLDVKELRVLLYNEKTINIIAGKFETVIPLGVAIIITSEGLVDVSTHSILPQLKLTLNESKCNSTKYIIVGLILILLILLFLFFRKKIF